MTGLVLSSNENIEGLGYVLAGVGGGAGILLGGIALALYPEADAKVLDLERKLNLAPPPPEPTKPVEEHNPFSLRDGGGISGAHFSFSAAF